MNKSPNSIGGIKTDKTGEQTPLMTFCCDFCKCMYNENNPIKYFTDDLKLVCISCGKKKSDKTVIDRSNNDDLFVHSKQNLSLLKAQEMGRLKKLTCEIHKGEEITRFQIKEEKIKLGCDICHPTRWLAPPSGLSIDKFLDVFGFYFPECDSCITALEFEIKRLEFTCPNIERLRIKISSLTDTFKSTTLDDLLQSKELFSIKQMENQNKLKNFIIIYNPINEIRNNIMSAKRFLNIKNSITKDEIEDSLTDLIEKSNVNLKIISIKENQKELDYLNQKELIKNHHNGPEDQQSKEKFDQEMDLQEDQQPHHINNQEFHSKCVKNHEKIKNDLNYDQSLQSHNEPKRLKFESQNLKKNPKTEEAVDKVCKKTISDCSSQNENMQKEFDSNNQNALSCWLETAKPETNSSKERKSSNFNYQRDTKQNDETESFEKMNMTTPNKSEIKTTINSKTNERSITENRIESGADNDGNNADDLKQHPTIATEEGSQNIIKAEIEKAKTESKNDPGNSRAPNFDLSQFIKKNKSDQKNVELLNTLYGTKREDKEINKIIILEENKSPFRDEFNKGISDFGEIEKENKKRSEERNKGEITDIESYNSKQTTVVNDYKLDSETKTDQHEKTIRPMTDKIETLKSINKTLKEEIDKQNSELIINKENYSKEIESMSEKNAIVETDREKSKILLMQETFELKARADDNLKEIVTIDKQVKALESIVESNHSKFEAEINQKTTQLKTKIIKNSEKISPSFKEELQKLKSTQSTDKETLMGEIKIIADSNSNSTQTMNKSIEDANEKILNLESSDKIQQTDLNNFNRALWYNINSELIKKIKKIEEDFEAKNEKFKENQKLIEQLQTEFKTSNDLFKLELKEKDEKIEEQNKSNEIFKQELKNSNDEFMSQLKFKNDELETQLAFQKILYEAEKKEIDMKFDVLEKSFNGYKTQTDVKIHKLETDNQQIKGDLSQLISVIETNSTLSIKELDKKIDENKQKINEIESLSKTIQTNQQNFEESLGKTKNDLKTESDKIQTLLIQLISETKSTLNQKIEKIEKLMIEKNDELKQKMNKLTKSFEIRNKEFENLIAENKRVSDESIQISNKSMKEMMIRSEQNFEEKLADRTQKINGIIQEVQNLMKEKFKSVDEKFEDFQNQITGNKNKLIERMSEDKKSFQEKLNEVKNQLKQNEEKVIEEMNKIKGSFDERTKEIQNQIKNNEDRLSGTIHEMKKSLKDQEALFSNQFAQMNSEFYDQKSLFIKKWAEVDQNIKDQETSFDNKLKDQCESFNNKLAEMKYYMYDISNSLRDIMSESEKRSLNKICEKSNETDMKISEMRNDISRDILKVTSDLQSEILDTDIPKRYPLLEQLLLVNDLRQHLQLPDMKRELECKIAQTEQSLANQIHSKSNELQKNIEESTKNSNKYLLKVELELKKKIERMATNETTTPTGQSHQNETTTPTGQSHQNDAVDSSTIKEQIIRECNNYTDEMLNKFSNKLEEVEQKREAMVIGVYPMTKMHQSNSRTHTEDDINASRFKIKQKEAPDTTRWTELQQNQSFSESVVLSSPQTRNEASALMTRLKFSQQRFLFRMSNSTRSFHEVCDGLGDTLILFKLKEDTLLAYVDSPWSSPSTPQHGSSERSFFYSLNSNKVFALNAGKKNTALYHSASQGPCFGDNEFSSLSQKNTVFVCHPGNTFIDQTTKKSLREVLFGDSIEVFVENYEVYALK